MKTEVILMALLSIINLFAGVFCASAEAEFPAAWCFLWASAFFVLTILYANDDEEE